MRLQFSLFKQKRLHDNFRSPGEEEEIQMYTYIIHIHVLMEGRKKQARSCKQQGKATQHTQGSHFSCTAIKAKWKMLHDINVAPSSSLLPPLLSQKFFLCLYLNCGTSLHTMEKRESGERDESPSLHRAQDTFRTSSTRDLVDI